MAAGGAAPPAACPSLQERLQAGLLQVEGTQRRRVAQEEIVRILDVVVLAVPAVRQLVLDEPPLALLEHLAAPVRLSADRVVAQQEAQREDAAPLEAHVVPAFGEVEGGRARLPALALHAVVLGRLFPAREVRARVHAGAKGVVDRGEVEHAEVDQVEADAVDPADRVAQRHAGPRRLADLVGVVVDVPVGAELARELALARQQRSPRGPAAGAVGALEPLDRQQPTAEPALCARDRLVGRAVVDQVGPHAVRREVLEYRLDDVRLVVGGDQRDDAEGVVEHRGGEPRRRGWSLRPGLRSGRDWARRPLSRRRRRVRRAGACGVRRSGLG